MRRRLCLSLACLGMLGCEQDLAFSARRGLDIWKQAPTDQVDILFVVDNSKSMSREQGLLSAGFDSFIENIENDDVDFHIGVITTDFAGDDPERGQLIGDPAVITRDTTANVDGEVQEYQAVFKSRALVGTDGSGKEKGLDAAAFALSPQMTVGPNAGFLRADANLLLVFVSDEDDCSDEGALGLDAPNTDCYASATRDKLVPVSNYADTFLGLKDSASAVQVAAIVGPEDATSVCGDETLAGRRYLELTRLTGGTARSICETEEVWRTFLSEMGLAAVGILTTFKLSRGAKEETLVVKVDGVEVPQDGTNGFTYDATAFTIEFHGDAVPPRGAEVSAEYEIRAGT